MNEDREGGKKRGSELFPKLTEEIMEGEPDLWILGEGTGSLSLEFPSSLLERALGQGRGWELRKRS